MQETGFFVEGCSVKFRWGIKIFTGGDCGSFTGSRIGCKYPLEGKGSVRKNVSKQVSMAATLLSKSVQSVLLNTVSSKTYRGVGGLNGNSLITDKDEDAEGDKLLIFVVVRRFLGKSCGKRVGEGEVCRLRFGTVDKSMDCFSGVDGPNKFS